MPLQYAALHYRGAAFLIDALPILLTFWLPLPLYMIGLGWTIVYATFESSPWQATWGKRLFGLRVMEAEGRKLTFPRAFVRSALKLLPFMIFPFGGTQAALLIIATVLGITLHQRCRAWYDLLACTSVFKLPAGYRA